MMSFLGQRFGRRSFLEYLSYGFIGTFSAPTPKGLDQIVISQLPEVHKTIAFEEAAATEDSSLRQEYINQIVKRMGKPDCVLEVIYDHDGSLSKKAEEQKWNDVFNDPKQFQRYMWEFLEVYFKSEEREKARQEILNTKEGKEGFKNYLLSAIPEESAAYTHSDSTNIGGKSTVYITKKVFEEWKVKLYRTLRPKPLFDNPSLMLCA